MKDALAEAAQAAGIKADEIGNRKDSSTKPHEAARSRAGGSRLQFRVVPRVFVENLFADLLSPFGRIQVGRAPRL
jgi:hypothetical protein